MSNKQSKTDGNNVQEAFRELTPQLLLFALLMLDIWLSGYVLHLSLETSFQQSAIAIESRLPVQQPVDKEIYVIASFLKSLFMLTIAILAGAWIKSERMGE